MGFCVITRERGTCVIEGTSFQVRRPVPEKRLRVGTPLPFL